MYWEVDQEHDDFGVTQAPPIDETMTVTVMQG